MTTNFGGVTREGKLLYLTFFEVCENDFLVFKGITDPFDFSSLGGGMNFGLGGNRGRIILDVSFRGGRKIMDFEFLEALRKTKVHLKNNLRIPGMKSFTQDIRICRGCHPLTEEH